MVVKTEGELHEHLPNAPILPSAPSSPGPSDAGKRLLPWPIAVAFFMESLEMTILVRMPLGLPLCLCLLDFRTGQRHSPEVSLHQPEYPLSKNEILSKKYSPIYPSKNVASTGRCWTQKDRKPSKCWAFC